MRIYGIDFTSSPSQRKGFFLAVCTLLSDTLEVQRLDRLNAKADGDFSTFEDWLGSRGQWDEPAAWVAGIDFPFGLPVEAIEHFGWLTKTLGAQTWEAYMCRIGADYTDAAAFRQCIENWKHPTRLNKKKTRRTFIRKLRLTDKLARSGSPMNYYPPPVCPMFFQGAKRLLRLSSGVSIQPVRPMESTKAIVETYPRLVANVFIGAKASYKDESKKKDKELKRQDEATKKKCREQILAGITSDNPEGGMRSRYRIHVRMPEALRIECLDDNDGDKLDSVLCAVQAGWAYRAEDYGMPQFTVKSLREQVRLEGWIADPAVGDRMKSGES